MAGRAGSCPEELAGRAAARPVPRWPAERERGESRMRAATRMERAAVTCAGLAVREAGCVTLSHPAECERRAAARCTCGSCPCRTSACGSPCSTWHSSSRAARWTGQRRGASHERGRGQSCFGWSSTRSRPLGNIVQPCWRWPGQLGGAGYRTRRSTARGREHCTAERCEAPAATSGRHCREET